MNQRDGLFLRHVLLAIEEIESFTVEGQHSFMSDRKTQSAVVRQLEIIGEAVKNLSAALTTTEPGVPWRQIAGTRDRLVHAYFKVDFDAPCVISCDRGLPRRASPGARAKHRILSACHSTSCSSAVPAT